MIHIKPMQRTNRRASWLVIASNGITEMRLPSAEVRAFLRSGPLFNAFNAVYPDEEAVSAVVGFGSVHLGIQPMGPLDPTHSRGVGMAAVCAVAEPEGKGFRPALLVVTDCHGANTNDLLQFHLFAWFLHALT